MSIYTKNNNTYRRTIFELDSEIESSITVQAVWVSQHLRRTPLCCSCRINRENSWIKRICQCSEKVRLPSCLRQASGCTILTGYLGL